MISPLFSFRTTRQTSLNPSSVEWKKSVSGFRQTNREFYSPGSDTSEPAPAVHRSASNSLYSQRSARSRGHRCRRRGDRAEFPYNRRHRSDGDVSDTDILCGLASPYKNTGHPAALSGTGAAAGQHLHIKTRVMRAQHAAVQPRFQLFINFREKGASAT